METYDALARAITSTETIIAGVRPGQHGDPTPCSEWDVRALLNHTVGSLWLLEALLNGRPPRHSLSPGGLPDVDLLGDDPATAFKEASQVALAAAAHDDALTQIHTTPVGELPGAVLTGFATLDVFVHGWDLARATGQAVAFDDDMATHAMGFAQQAIGDANRAPLIGPAVPVAETAPTIDRLAGFLGRRP